MKQKYKHQKAENYRKSNAVSRSDLFNMKKSPAHYLAALTEPEKKTEAFAFGTAFHTLRLEPKLFKKKYAVLPKLDMRFKENREHAKKLEESGKTIITEEDFKTMNAMCNSVLSNRYAKVLLNGEHEASYYWIDDMTGIKCKCRPDCRTDLKSTSVIIDVKTCTDASTDAFMKDCIKYGYDLQAAMYSTGVEAVEQKKHKFVFLAVEKKPPYALNVLEADEFLIRKGYDDFRLYLGMLKECSDSGNFYGYNGADGIPNALSLPAWLIKEYE